MTAANYTYEKHTTSSSVAASDPFAGLDLLADLSALLERRDPYTYGHSRRVAAHAGRIARAMHLPILETTRIGRAGAIHDVGKLATPRAILNNPGRLTAAEFAVLKHHAADGAEMVAAIADARITQMVRHHHERVDGRGYPDGLAGSEIPLGARIIAVADTFDALTSDRAYRRAGSLHRALDVLSAQAGTQLDANAVAAFLGCCSPRADNLLSMQSPLTTWR
jgi:HD-GYP domain-containing protein (c-di-GMP phosphodiesterase class II)